MARRTRKPKPISTSVVCSECGLPWDKHSTAEDEEVTLASCVGLLKAELAKRPLFTYSGTTGNPRFDWGTYNIGSANAANPTI